MRLSKICLTRGNQKILLQGMIHIGPEKLYEILQHDINWATENNYQIFFEGVKKNPIERDLGQNEENIQKFFSFLLDLYPVFAESLGISAQKEKILYPTGSINADITFDALTKKLDENGFKCNLFLKFIDTVDKNELKEYIKKHSANQNLIKMMNKRNRWSLGNLMMWFAFRKATPIILDYRNEVAIEKIRIHEGGRDIFIHYGEKHVKGIMKLLKKDGWTISSTTYIDLADFIKN